MPLIRNGKPAEDEYAFAADGAPLPDGPVIVTLTRLRRDRGELLERNARLGVLLKSDESPEALGSDLDRLSLVVLEFPKFRDGRPFGWARMLRTRLAFKGEIRAAGDFLADQIAFMARTGFDAFVWNGGAEAFERALAEISNVYQPSADGRKTIAEMRRATSPSRP
jgi:uncharacterized protein (DUF934 family)